MDDVDNREYWGLFENRPAKERTSAPAAEETRTPRDRIDSWSRLQRNPRADAAERSKC